MHAQREKRVQAALDVDLENGKGVTRDVSTSGIYFETEVPLAEGSPVSFTLNFNDSPGGPLRLKCEAIIVRVEKRDGKIGVAASIKEYKFERLDASVGEPA